MAATSTHRSLHKRRLTLALAITASFLIAEIVGGILTGSLALIADGGHMASDAAALGLALGAIWLASRPPSQERTYGMHRAEILAAFVNSLALVLVAVYIFWEASGRFSDPPEVSATPMLVIAAVGLGANLVSMSVLYRDRGQSLNLRAAFLHVSGDALGSIGAIVAGIIMLATGSFLADPVISVVIGALIVFSAVRITWDSTQVLLEAAPPGIKVSEVQRHMLDVDGVASVHDLHVWTVTSGFISLSAHVEADESGDSDQMLVQLRQALSQDFGIDHATIQIETLALHQELENCCGVDTEEVTHQHALHHA
jgi:cobalt-zinc-cadmium efflux system protein